MNMADISTLPRAVRPSSGLKDKYGSKVESKYNPKFSNRSDITSKPSNTTPQIEYLQRLVKEWSDVFPSSENQDPDYLKDWITCFRINKLFLKPSHTGWKCLWCKRTIPRGYFLERSEFLQRLVNCPKGHTTHLKKDMGLCVWCENETIFRISNSTQKCFEPSCGCFLKVDYELAKSLLHRYKVNMQITERYLKILRGNTIFECIACFDLKPLDTGIHRRITAKCCHDIDMCYECVMGLLRASIKTKHFEEIRCPSENCNEILSVDDVKQLADPVLFQTYEREYNFHQLINDPNFRWCSNPSDRCQSGQLHPPGDSQPKWKCSNCGFRNCFTERCKWHSGLTCQEHRLKQDSNDLSLEEVKRRSKKCPNAACQMPIEKNNGCKDMTCSRYAKGCGITFCWNCKIIYNAGVESHLRGCPHRGNKLPAPYPKNDPRYARDWDKDPGYNPESKAVGDRLLRRR